MSFFYKLFPYRSFFQFDGDTITAWWVAVTIAIFAWFSYLIIKAVNNIKSNVGSALQDLSVDNFKKSLLLKPIWQEYESTLITIGNKRKTDEKAYDYFNERSLLISSTNLKIINTIPSTLVGLGILGTFVGLTFGISDFKTTSSDEIKNSISTLLSGMGTAFVSSIWGMLLSLIFTFIEKVKVNSLHDSLHALCFQLDRQYNISKEDERQMELVKQKEMLDSYFSTTDDVGNILKPANVLRDIYNESRKQSQSLQAFSTDLAMKIEAGFSQILDQQNHLNTIPILEKLQSEINQLGTKLQNPASEMTQNVVKELENAIDKMLTELKTSISGSTKSEMESLAGMLSSAGASLSSFPEMMKETSNGINLLVSKLGNELNDKIGGIQKGQGELIEKQKDGLQLTKTLLTSFTENVRSLNSFTSEFKTAADSFNKSHYSLEQVVKRFDDTAKTIHNSSTIMSKSQVDTQAQMNQFFTEAKRTIQEMQNSFDKAKLLTTEYGQKFEVIEIGLKSIFGQIQEGLSDYQKSVGESLETYLGKYSAALTTTASALASASESQEQLVNDLIEEVSKLNGRARV